VKTLALPEKARKEYAKAQQAFKRQDYERTVKDLQATVAIESGFAPAYNLLGLAYWRMQKLDLAKDAFKNAMREDPKFLQPYLNYGEMLIDKQDLEHAAEVLEDAGKKWPGRPEPLYVMAQMQFTAGNLNSAEQACRGALERDPNAVPDAHLLLSNIYLRENRLDLVGTELEGYLKTAPFGSFAKAARQNLAKIKSILASGLSASHKSNGPGEQ
jgi:tetratricopeptide (TPR) repeat protein